MANDRSLKLLITPGKIEKVKEFLWDLGLEVVTCSRNQLTVAGPSDSPLMDFIETIHNIVVSGPPI